MAPGIRPIGGARGSRRRLMKGCVAAVAGQRAARASARAQTPTAATLRFTGWVHREPSTRDTMRRTLDMFEQIYGVRVEAVPIKFDADLTELQDKRPDVVQLSGNQPRLLGEAGFLANLEELRPEVDGRFQQDGIDAGTHDGVLYAIPFTTAPLGLWYSKKAMKRAGRDPEKPPATISDLTAHLTALYNAPDQPRGFAPIRIDISGEEYSVTRFWPWIWACDGDPLRDDGHGNLIVNWTDAGTIQAFTWLQEISSKDYILQTRTGWWDRQYFAHDRIGFMMDGPYVTSQMVNHNAAFGTRRDVAAAFGVTTTPVLRETLPPVAVADFHHLAIAADSPNPALARDLLMFLTTNEHAIETFLIPQGGLLPRDEDIESHRPDYDDAIGATFIDNIAPSMRLPPYGPLYEKIWRPIGAAIQEIALDHKAPVARRLAQLDADVKAILEQ